MTSQSIVIIGGGLAGFTTAQELRRRGHDGRLTIVDPDGVPYDRPPLSKEYLLGTRDQEAIRFQPEEWYREQDIEIVADRAVGLDPATRAVSLAGGESLTADRVVLATGGSARPLPVPGGDLDTVLTLRHRADADRLRASITEGTRLVILGAGLIGAETASSAKELGADVVLVDPMEPPLVPAVGPEIARRLHEMHTTRGVRTITGGCREITAADGVHTVTLQDGSTIEADLVLVGIGIVPVTDLAADAGLEVDDGVIVDEHQRTSDPWAYAVGDVSRSRLADGTLTRRAEHWEHAMQTGSTAAASLMEEELPTHGAPWFWSDRHGVHVEGVGSMAADGETVLRERDGEIVAAFRLAEDGAMLGCAAVDDGHTVRAARRIIDRGILADPAQLADPTVPVKKLAKAQKMAGASQEA